MKHLLISLCLLIASGNAHAGKAFACNATDATSDHLGHSPTLAGARAKAAALCRQQSPAPAGCAIFKCLPYTWQDPRPPTRAERLQEARTREVGERAKEAAIAATIRAEESQRQDKLDQMIREYEQRRR